jgi:hypothetical protein
MEGGGPQCARAGATMVGSYSRYAHAVVDSLHVEATGALRCGTAGLGVRAWWADRQRAHAAWCAGSPAETRPGGACCADAHRARAPTLSTSRGTVVHGGGVSATRGITPERATSRRARSRPGPSGVPMFACTILKNLHVSFTTGRHESCRWVYPLEFGQSRM